MAGALKSKVPFWVLVFNVLTRNLLRVGVPLGPMQLLTVRGRKSGLPRTTPIAIAEMNGKRYVITPYGVVDWVRNLRAAGEAVIWRGRRSETIRAMELPPNEAGPLLKRIFEQGMPSFLAQNFDVTTRSSDEEFEHTVVRHPIFSLEHIPSSSSS